MRYRKKETFDVTRWDERAETLASLRSAGIEWLGNASHVERPGWIGRLEVKTMEGRVQVQLGDMLVRIAAHWWHIYSAEKFQELFEPVAAEPDLLTACDAVMEFLSHGTAIYPGSLAACDLEDAVRKAKGLTEKYRTGQDGPMPF